MRSNDHFLRNMYIRIASEHSYLLVHHNQQQHQYHPSSTVDISLSSSSLTVNVQETTCDRQLHDNHAHCTHSSPRGNFSAPHCNSNCRLSHLRKSFMRVCVCLYSSTRKTTSLATHTHTHIHITRLTNLLLFLFFYHFPSAQRIHHATRQRRQPRNGKCHNDLRRTSLVRQCQ